MALIELRQVSKEYVLGDNRLLALNRISTTIGQGEFSAIWGPSGSGKSTLLNLIGLLDRPTHGQLVIDGRETTTLNDKALTDLRYQTLGFVFQNYNLIPVLSAIENVMLPLQMRGINDKQARHRARTLLEAVQLDRYTASRPDQLSGGQRQRVAIARALVTHPRIVLADEPTANLDSHTSQLIIDLMRELNRRQGVTFLFSTHDARLLDSVDRLLHMCDGRLTSEAATSATQEILDARSQEEVV